MKRRMAARAITGLLVAAVAGLWSAAAQTPPAPPPSDACAALAGLVIDKVAVTAAATVPAGAFTAEGVRRPLTVPVFCRVQAVARPTADSEIRFEVWLPPKEKWNGKFQGTGTGGYDGSISYAAIAAAVAHGYAATSTDTGHVGGDLKFGAGHPEKVRDWAYRAMHVTAIAAKLMTRDYYGRWPDHSYYVGCATGGHQALSEAQRYPEDYDGIVAGDPGNDRLNETAGYVSAWLALHDADGKPLLTQADLQLVTATAVATCDRDDGVADGVIDDPRRCRFNPAVLLCKAGQSERCLSATQVDAVKKVYAGTRNPRTGALIFPGWSIGSEGYGPAPNDGWGAWLLDPKIPMRSEVYNDFVFDNPGWNFRSFDFDKDVSYAQDTIPWLAAEDRDLTAFQARHGKLILYAGWSDPVAASEDIVKYGTDVVKVMGVKRAAEFFRFYMVPGMGHCSGGPGTTSFDMLGALEQWVEHGRAPDRIVAARPDGTRTRPLCVYPKAARWTGKGSSDDAANFVCKIVG
ncbi:MAG: tannase/feruloyl esterase family alpha/beta hydrolase [Rhizomicrobium sp.]